MVDYVLPLDFVDVKVGGESRENIYFYDAWLMSQGELPYRDFFFAHPPLGLIPGWLVFVLLGEFAPTRTFRGHSGRREKGV